MKQNEYPIIAFSNETYLLGYEASNPKLTRNYRASDISGGGGFNIYNSNGTLIGDRTVDLDGKKLMFLNGNMYLGTTGVVNTFKLEISSLSAGVIVFNTTGSSFNANTTNGRLFTGSTANGFGLSLQAPFNELYDNGNPTPTAPSSVLMEYRSSTRGILGTRMTYAQRIAISSPEPFLEVTQTNDVGLSLAGKYIFMPVTGCDRIKLASE